MNLKDLTALTSNYLALIAILGFGVVVVGSGYQGMEANSTVAGLGVTIIFADMLLWCRQNRLIAHTRKKIIPKKRT